MLSRFLEGLRGAAVFGAGVVLVFWPLIALVAGIVLVVRKVLYRD